MSRPEIESSSFSPVSLAKSATATVTRSVGICRFQIPPGGDSGDGEPHEDERGREGRDAPVPTRALQPQACGAERCEPGRPVLGSRCRVLGKRRLHCPRDRPRHPTERRFPSHRQRSRLRRLPHEFGFCSRRLCSGNRGGRPLHRALPGEHLAEHHPRRPHVRPLVHDRARRLLRRHVRRRSSPARPLGSEQVRKAEVEQLHPPVFADEHVRGLQVPVQHPPGMRVREPLRHLLGDPQRLVHRQGTLLDALRQRLAAEQFHDEVGARRAGPDIEDGDDGRMVELRDRLGLLLDPLLGEPVPVASRLQCLERDRTPQLRVEGLVDRAEPTPSDLPTDLVAADEVARLERLPPGRGGVLGRRLCQLLEEA